jgi:hypothetical protein
MAGSMKKEDCSSRWPGQNMRPYLKNNEKKGLEAGLKQQSTYLASMKP